MTSPSPNSVAVSVVVPSYGRPERLARLVEQLLDQDAGSLAYEVIVVDDGSPEPVGAALERLETRVPLRCIRQENGGPAAARNRGAREARGETILFVDDDFLVPPDFVRAHAEAQREVGPGAINGYFEWQVDAEPESFRRWYRERIVEWGDAHLAQIVRVADGIFEIPSGHLTAANLSVPRAEFERVGGFDTGYFAASCEDQDFALRLTRSGVKAFLLKRAVSTHVETHLSLPRLCERQRRGAADTVRFIRRFAELLPEDPPIVAANGPVRLGQDSPSRILRKLARILITAGPLAGLAFGAVRVLERSTTNARALDRLYNLMIGAYIQKGWREGLVAHGESAALTGLLPTTQQ